MVQRTDAELVALARCGDKQAFSRLNERYQLIAFRFARSMVVQSDIAQDLVQEAFLQAYLSLDRLRKVNYFQSWLCGIVLNLCRSHLRHQKVTLLSFEEIMGGLQVDVNPFRLFRAFGEAVRSLKILRLPTSSADHAVSPESSTQS